MNLLLAYIAIISPLSVIVLVWALSTERAGWWVWLLLVVLLLGVATHAGSLKSLDSAPTGPLTRVLFCTPQQREQLKLLGLSESRRISCNPNQESLSKQLVGYVTVKYAVTVADGKVGLVVETISP